MVDDVVGTFDAIAIKRKGTCVNYQHQLISAPIILDGS